MVNKKIISPKKRRKYPKSNVSKKKGKLMKDSIKKKKKISKKTRKLVKGVLAKSVSPVVVKEKVILQKKKGGFFSRLFGLDNNVLDKNLSKSQRRSLKLIKKKEVKILKNGSISKIHPKIVKKLEKIDELKKVANKKDTFAGKVREKVKVAKTKEGVVTKEEGIEYLKTFVPGFDDLISPGIPRGAAVLIEGGPGSGKTLMCLNMLSELCKKGKKVLYMSFEEPEERLRSHINSFGLDAVKYEKKGLLYLKRFNALDIARSVEALLSEAKKELLIDVQPVLIPKDFQPDVVILDSLSSISSAFSGEASRFRIYMEQLFRYLEGHNINSFLIREVASPTHIGGVTNEAGGEAVSFLSDGIIAIYNVIFDDNHRKRAIEVLKMRGVKIDRRICEYEILGDCVKIHSKKTLKGKFKLT